MRGEDLEPLSKPAVLVSKLQLTSPTGKKTDTRWVSVIFVLYSLNRCRHGKINKIKGFGVLETVSSASLIDADEQLCLFTCFYNFNFGYCSLIEHSSR